MALRTYKPALTVNNKSLSLMRNQTQCSPPAFQLIWPVPSDCLAVPGGGQGRLDQGIGRCKKEPCACPKAKSSVQIEDVFFSSKRVDEDVSGRESWPPCHAVSQFPGEPPRGAASHPRRTESHRSRGRTRRITFLCHGSRPAHLPAPFRTGNK